jgi:uncharacterized membrane protein
LVGTFNAYIIANIALAVSTKFAETMAFRALKAAGSSAVVSIGPFPLVFTRLSCSLFEHISTVTGARVIANITTSG